MSMTASTLPHAPLYRSVKRQDPTLKSKRSTAGNAERPVDSGVLDGWSLIFGPKTEDGKTRFVYVDSSSS